jgi:hypothetical protein
MDGVETERGAQGNGGCCGGVLRYCVFAAL